MEAKELRIGNYCKLEEMLHQITVWDFACLEREDYSENDYTPIPLSEEWLIKFGFEVLLNDQYQISVSVNNRICYINCNLETGIDVDIWTEHEGTGAWLNTKNKYVHQLQNLYFALTGEELTIKEYA